MNTEEQRLIDGLFGRIRQAEDPAQPRDAQAQACIEEHLRQQPAAPYYMAQAILVQEAALKRLDEQNKQLQAELQQAKAEPRDSGASSNGGGGFLSSLFGSNNRQAAPSAPSQAPTRPASPPASGGGWRDGPQSAAPAAAQAAPAAAPARGGAGSFLGGAMQTAAGVAGGVLLAQGISSLFNHGSQPQEVVEVIEEAPAPASEQGGWHDQDGQQQVADNADYGNEQGGLADTGYDTDYGGDYGSDDGGSFSDDDSFI